MTNINVEKFIYKIKQPKRDYLLLTNLNWII